MKNLKTKIELTVVGLGFIAAGITLAVVIYLPLIIK